MIYERVDAASPLQQGDILFPLPLLAGDPLRSLIFHEEETEVIETWIDSKPDSTDLVTKAKKTWGVVATPDCDALRSPTITLFQVGELASVSGQSLPSADATASWVRFITREAKLSPGWLYLPADTAIVGFPGRMAVDFNVAFQLQLDSLSAHLGELRHGRLGPVALEHFQYATAFYFTRFAYDDWYPLTREEFVEYARRRGAVQPYNWQT